MIHTIVAGEDVSRARDRQQSGVDDAHGDAPLDEVTALRRARVLETDRLTTENGELRRRLRMAKARARSRRL